MNIFLEKFRDAIHGIVEGFDRLIFKVVHDHLS